MIKNLNTDNFASQNPSLMLEWNYEKNKNIDPHGFTSNSHKIVWWKCKTCGQSWQASIQNRVAHNSGCPYCHNKRTIPGINDLCTVYPDLAKEWNYQKNGILKPSDFLPHSNKKVWWICDKNHEWKACINNRVNGASCPICLQEQKSSLPEQAVYYYASQKYSSVNRAKIAGWEIDVYLPDYRIGIEYDGMYFHSLKGAQSREERKRDDLSKAGVTLMRLKESKQKSSVIGNTISYKLEPKYKNLDEGLIMLFSRIKIITGVDLPDINFQRDHLKIYNSYEHYEKSNNLADKYPEIAKEWNYERNGNLKPEMYYPGSNEVVWWKCNTCGHEWKASVNSRALRNTGCPSCSKADRSRAVRTAKLHKGVNDLATVYPDLAKEWDFEKNIDMIPSDYSIGSHKKVWWICPIHNTSYQCVIKNRVNGHGCPVCGNVKKATSHRINHLDVGVNDLKTKFPELVLDWDYEKNGDLLPENCSYGSHDIVWWKCHNCGYEWHTSINHRTSGAKCPKCKK